jgi:putative sigma-54 modulation protein
MLVELTGRNVEITPRLRTLADGRIERLERHVGGPVSARVILTHEKHRFRAEILATHRRQRWTANEETSDARSALVEAFEKVDGQATKHAGRRRDRKHRGAADVRPLRAADGNGGDSGSRGRAVLPDRRIVRVGRRGPAAKPMTVEEAAMRIDGSREDFVVFRDSGSEKVSVLYKRRDGDFALIVPEW